MECPDPADPVAEKDTGAFCAMTDAGTVKTAMTSGNDVTIITASMPRTTFCILSCFAISVTSLLKLPNLFDINFTFFRLLPPPFIHHRF